MATEQSEISETHWLGFAPSELLDGVYYPSSDEGPVEEAETHYQFKALTDTAWALKRRFGDMSTMYVAGDMFIYYRPRDISARIAPDVFVVAGAKGNHPRYRWRTWAEEVAPQFVLEVASESTWTQDASAKRYTYKDMGVLEYWRFDPESGKYLQEILIGERLVNGEYVRIPVQTDADGILRGRSDFLNLDLCVLSDAQLHLYDPVAGEWLRTPDETDDALRERDAQLLGANAALRERDTEIARLRAALQAARGEG